MSPPIAIAMSGGIDSLVSAYLLKAQGRDVLGIHFITGYEPPLQADAEKTAEEEAIQFRAYRKQIRERFAAVSRQLGIPIEILDLRRAFSTHVVSYFIDTYSSGKTPNPCLVCNPVIKFGEVLRFARSQGAAALATGHYARRDDEKHGRLRLLKGIDSHKDQSYFLARLTPLQLEQARFPLGGMTKRQAIALAKEKGLIPLSRTESQDVCFIANMPYSDFIARHGGSVPAPGPIVDMAGRVIGRHRGLHRFTVGQRRGINCPGPAPYYVVKIDMTANRLVVGFKASLYTDQCRVSQINWIAAPPSSPITVETRLRYRHKAVASTLEPSGRDSAVIVFNAPQPAVTSGQGAVFYQGDEVLGGGWIE